MTKKYYQDTDKNLHPAVKILKDKGYTDITFCYIKATRRDCGWQLETKQTGWKKAGYDMTSAMAFIKSLPTISNI